jgi:hypothetical protein
MDVDLMAKKIWTAEERAAASAKQKAVRAAKREASAALPADEPEAPPIEEPEEAGAVTLDDEEIEKIRRQAREKVAVEIADIAKMSKKALMAKTLDDEILRQRREAGLTDYRDDLVDVLIDVAPYTDRITIDDKMYMHGHWYLVPRRVFDVIREQMARSWDSEERAGNPNRRFRREVAGTMNPLANEQRLSDGSLTLGLDSRVHGTTGAVMVGR